MRRSVLRATAGDAGLSTPGSWSAVAVTATKERRRTIFVLPRSLIEQSGARREPGLENKGGISMQRSQIR
eukprot:scaffold1487_cov72-Phaeocystis_antarctica.AAC.2